MPFSSGPLAPLPHKDEQAGANNNHHTEQGDAVRDVAKHQHTKHRRNNDLRVVVRCQRRGFRIFEGLDNEVVAEPEQEPRRDKEAPRRCRR